MKYKRILWTISVSCLILFFAGVTVQAAKSDDNTQVVERLSKLYDSPEQIPVPAQSITDESGRRLYIKTQEIEAVRQTGRKTSAESEILYQGVEKDMELPETAKVQVTDEASKATFMTELLLASVSYENERWEDLLSFTVTFHQYGAGGYLLEDEELYLPDSCTEAEAGAKLSAVSERLLRLIGMDPQDCHIEGFRWNGNPYTDGEGVLCRDGNVWGSLKVFDCRAAYQGTVSLPDLDRYRLHTIYEAEAETAESTQEPPSSAEFKSEGAEDSSSDPGFLKRLLLAFRKHFKLTIGLFLIVLAAIGLRYLIRAAKILYKRWREKDER